MRKVALALAIVVSAGAPALADISSAELATGGLVFVPNKDVEMRSEHLMISAKTISVHYTFYNKSDNDVTLLVAFPLPEVGGRRPRENMSLPTENPVNIFAFATSVNGRPVMAEVEQRIIAAGIDRTQLLQDIGIPFAPHLQSTNDALDRLPQDKWDELVRIGLAEIEEVGIGPLKRKHLSARWKLQITFYWEQAFPAKTETVIEHHYKPSVGVSSGTLVGAPEMKGEPRYKEYRRKYCINDKLDADVKRAKEVAKGGYGPTYREERIDYILRTGANWSGPIKQFRLVVDKGAPQNFVSFCGNEVHQISPTQVEMRETDFAPKGDLSILILEMRVSQ